MAQCDQIPETARTANDNGHVIAVASLSTTFSPEQTGPGFGAAHLAMLLVLAQRQGRNDHTWASQDDLARCARMGKRAGVDVLAELVAFGWVGRRGPVKSSRGIELHHWVTIPGRPIPERGTAESAAALSALRGGTADSATGVRQNLHDRYGRFCKGGTAESADKKTTEKTTEQTTEQTTPPSEGTRAGEAGGVVSVGEVSVEVMREEPSQPVTTTEPIPVAEREEQAAKGETFALTHPEPFAPPPCPPKPKDPKKAAAARERAVKSAKDKARARVEAWHPHDGHGELANKLGVDLTDVLAQYRAELRAKPLYAPDDLDSGFEALIRRRAGRCRSAGPGALQPHGGWKPKDSGVDLKQMAAEARAQIEAARGAAPTPAPTVQADPWPHAATHGGGPGKHMRAAKFPGSCIVCGGDTHAGAEQWLYPRGPRHPGCVGAPKANAPQRGSTRKQSPGLPAATCPTNWDDI